MLGRGQSNVAGQELGVSQVDKDDIGEVLNAWGGHSIVKMNNHVRTNYI